MTAIAVVRKHMFANDREGMLHSVLLFQTKPDALAWAEANPPDQYTRVGNAYQYEFYTPKLVGAVV